MWLRQQYRRKHQHARLQEQQAFPDAVREHARDILIDLTILMT
jgi:hypothetical protein